VQHYRRTWGKVDLFPARFHDRFSHYECFARLQNPKYPYYVLDEEPVYMSLENQREEAANRLMDLGLFDFFLRPSLREGEVSSDVYKVNIAGMVQDNVTGELSFPDQDMVAQIRSLLEATAGMPVKTLLAEQDALLPTATQELPRPQTPGTATTSQQPSADSTVTAHPQLPPRRHRLPSRTG
jgi:hypothetical protein